MERGSFNGSSMPRGSVLEEAEFKLFDEFPCEFTPHLSGRTLITELSTELSTRVETRSLSLPRKKRTGLRAVQTIRSLEAAKGILSRHLDPLRKAAARSATEFSNQMVEIELRRLVPEAGSPRSPIGVHFTWENAIGGECMSARRSERPSSAGSSIGLRQTVQGRREVVEWSVLEEVALGKLNEHHIGLCNAIGRITTMQ